VNIPNKLFDEMASALLVEQKLMLTH